MKIELSALKQVCVTESEKKIETVSKETDPFYKIQDRSQRYKVVHKDTNPSTRYWSVHRDTGPSTEMLVHPQRYWTVHEQSDLSTRILDRPQAVSCITQKLGGLHRNGYVLSTFVLT